MLKRFLVPGVLALMTAACTTYVDDYEKAVYDMDPIYCYRTIGGKECHKEPKQQDAARLINYYGPSPTRFPKAEPMPEPVTYAPPPVNFFVRDFEPIPAASPRKDLRETLPWKQEALEVQRDSAANPAKDMKLPEQARVYLVDRKGADEAAKAAEQALFTPVKAVKPVELKGIPKEIPEAAPKPQAVTLQALPMTSDVPEIEELE